MSQERIEAAANALSEINGMRFDGFWSRLDEMEPEDKEHAIAEARFALERSDPFLFSDEAIEVAEELLREKFCVDENMGEFDATAVWGTPADIVATVAAALRGEA